MTLTKMQAMLGVATGLLAVAATTGTGVMRLEKRFAALDTRLGKLESAIKTLNASTPDERYKQLVKELMTYENSRSAPEAKTPGLHTFGGNSFPETAGAAADAPAVKVPQ